ncbi:MAG: hypothetical protein KA155_00425 [Alphaproteobacteria bacterium]|jgi:hypothetical protein|nr:hypothetical protein [Alphaproteobacteria bacterium]
MTDNEEGSALRCDGQALVDFLRELLPDAFWAITAIWPKGISGCPHGMRDICTKVFHPDEAEECKAWAERMNNLGFNIYFNPNPPRTKTDKKAKKEDIAEVRYLFVDVDPRAGEPLQKERERISKRLLGAPKDVPRPTLVIDSGGGYWGFWKLDTSVSLPQGRPEEKDADEEDEEESENDDDDG